MKLDLFTTNPSNIPMEKITRASVETPMIQSTTSKILTAQI